VSKKIKFLSPEPFAKALTAGLKPQLLSLVVVADCHHCHCDYWQGHAHTRWRFCLQQRKHNTLFDFFSLNR